MSNIEFDADIDSRTRYAPAPQSSSGGGQMGGVPAQFSRGSGAQSSVGLIRWLVQHGIMTGESSAKMVLGGIIVVNFVAAGLIMYYFVLR